MAQIRTIVPGQIETRDLHQFIVGSITPRPIALVSTINEDGVRNLAPYSFFNAFSSNPPILVFSSNRRVSNNTTKDTLHNVRVNGEVVVNMVNYKMLRQMAVASVEFPSDVSEFDKAGFTPISSETIQPARVAESPVQYECRVKEIITLGDHGGAGHLVICVVNRLHIDESIIDENDRIDPVKLDIVGRLGRAYYTRVQAENIMTVVQAVTKITIGYDQLPMYVRESSVLTGNDLGRLAGLEAIPGEEEIDEYLTNDTRFKQLVEKHAPSISFHQYAQELLTEDRRGHAMSVLLRIADVNN